MYILNFFLDNEKQLGIGLLNFICSQNGENVFSETEEVAITTQKSTEEGTPDIQIKSTDKFIYIEVKHDSGLGKEQIERYRKALGKEHAPIKQIVLLTKFSIDLATKNKEGHPDKYMRWYQIHRYFEGLKPKEEICKFLIDQFTDFLEGKQMAIQKVGWEYTNGIRALLNLVNMIGIAIEELGIKTYQKTAGWEWRGYYLESKDEFCGIYFEEPDSVYLFSNGLLNYKPQEKDFRFPFYEDDGGTYFELSLEDTWFFALRKDEQFDILKAFILACHTEAKRLKPTRNP